jgi:hypothetical protein
MTERVSAHEHAQNERHDADPGRSPRYDRSQGQPEEDPENEAAKPDWKRERGHRYPRVPGADPLHHRVADGKKAG